MRYYFLWAYIHLLSKKTQGRGFAAYVPFKNRRKTFQCKMQSSIELVSIQIGMPLPTTVYLERDISSFKLLHKMIYHERVPSTPYNIFERIQASLAPAILLTLKRQCNFQAKALKSSACKRQARVKLCTLNLFKVFSRQTRISNREQELFLALQNLDHALILAL